MSGEALALVVLMIVALACTAMLAITVVQLRRVVVDLRELTDEFVDRATPALEQLVSAAREAGGQVDRLDDLISTAASVTDVVEHATNATVRVLSNPVIKTAALAKGTARAARRARGRDVG